MRNQNGPYQLSDRRPFGKPCSPSYQGIEKGSISILSNEFWNATAARFHGSSLSAPTAAPGGPWRYTYHLLSIYYEHHPSLRQKQHSYRALLSEGGHVLHTKRDVQPTHYFASVTFTLCLGDASTPTNWSIKAPLLAIFYLEASNSKIKLLVCWKSGVRNLPPYQFRKSKPRKLWPVMLFLHHS